MWFRNQENEVDRIYKDKNITQIKNFKGTNSPSQLISILNNRKSILPSICCYNHMTPPLSFLFLPIWLKPHNYLTVQLSYYN